MANYPYVSPADENAQYLTSILSQYKPGQLGAAPTLGNQGAQVDYARQLAEALAQQQSAESGLGMADRLSQPEYAQNSGALGSIAMLAQAYAGKKLRGLESAASADAMTRGARAKAGMETEAEDRKIAREDAASTRERSRRDVVARQMGLSNRERGEFVETGKIPEGTKLTPIFNQNGEPFGYNGRTNEITKAQIAGSQLPPNVHIDPNMPPEDRAAAMADIQAGAPEGDAEYSVQQPEQFRSMQWGQQQQQQQRQAMADSRADESLGFQRSANQRAEEEAARKRNAPKAVTEDQSKSAGYALRMERALGSIAKSSKENPGANRPGVGTALLDMLPDAAGNMLKSGERQNIEAAQLDALDAALTLNTGAAYTKEQLFGLRKSYFPQPGDAEQTIKDKEERLKGLIETARIRARSAYPDGGGSAAAPQGDVPQAGRVLKYNPQTRKIE